MIKVSTQVLRTALDRVAKAVPSKSLVPITDAVIFIPDEGDYLIYTTDTNIFARTSLVCETDDSPVSFGVDFHKLHSIISKFSVDEIVNIKLDSSLTKVIVKSKNGKKRYSIPWYNPNDAIAYHVVEGDGIRVGIGDLMAACDSVRPLINAKSDLRPALSNFNITVGKDMTIYGTDAFSMGRVRIDMKGDKCDPILLGLHAIGALDPKEKGILTISQDENRILLKTASLEITAMRVDHEMPKLIETLFETGESERFVEFDYEDLIGAISRLNAFVGKDGYSVIHFEVEEEIIITATDYNGDSQGSETLEAVDKTVDKDAFSLNGRHLLEVLNQLKCGKLRMYIAESNTPILLKTDEVEHKEYLTARVAI